MTNYFAFIPSIKTLGRIKSMIPTVSINTAGNVYIGEAAIKIMVLKSQDIAIIRLMEDQVKRAIGFQVLHTLESIVGQLDTSIRTVKIHTAKSRARFITISIRQFLKKLGVIGPFNQLKIKKHKSDLYGEMWYVQIPKPKFKKLKI